ncbi:hypothetical protein BHE74_00021869 [Ensete ventricosum]|nr:hypothetical protein BHE74_00021869 [Ensete ventricosum]
MNLQTNDLYDLCFGSLGSAPFEAPDLPYKAPAFLGCCFPVGRNPFSSQTPRRGFVASDLPTPASSCVGSSPAAFYAAEHMMGLPQLDCRSVSTSTRRTSSVAWSSNKPADSFFEQDGISCGSRDDALDSVLNLRMLQSRVPSSRDDFSKFLREDPQPHPGSRQAGRSAASPPLASHDPSVRIFTSSSLFCPPLPACSILVSAARITCLFNCRFSLKGRMRSIKLLDGKAGLSASTREATAEGFVDCSRHGSLQQNPNKVDTGSP